MAAGVSEEFPQGTRRVHFSFDNVRVEPPVLTAGGKSVPLTPMLASRQCRDYAARVRMDLFRTVRVDLRGAEALRGSDGAVLGRVEGDEQVIEEVVREVSWTQVPIMIGSELCATRQPR